SSKRSPGGRRRSTPTTGAERSDQVGSVRTLTPSIWMSTVAWLTNVTRSRPPSTQRGGGELGGVSGKRRHGPRWVANVRRNHSPVVDVEGSGWWNRTPSNHAGSFHPRGGSGTAAATSAAIARAARGRRPRRRVMRSVYGRRGSRGADATLGPR